MNNEPKIWLSLEVYIRHGRLYRLAYFNAKKEYN